MYGYGYGYELTNNTAVAAVEGTKIASLARSISKRKRKCPIRIAKVLYQGYDINTTKYIGQEVQLAADFIWYRNNIPRKKK